MKNMMKLIEWLKNFVSEDGKSSSKRLVGIMCATFLCVALVTKTSPSDALVYSVASLSAVALGLTSYEKIYSKDRITFKKPEIVDFADDITKEITSPKEAI